MAKKKERKRKRNKKKHLKNLQKSKQIKTVW